MNTLNLAFQSAWKVLLVSVILGAGVPAVFAMGIRGLATSSGQLTTGAAPKPAARIVAIICFLIVIAAIALGLTIIIASGFGKVVSFDHIFPLLVDQKK